MKLICIFIHHVQFIRNYDLGHDDKKIYFCLKLNSGCITKNCNLQRNHHHPVLCSFATISLSNVNIWWTLNMIVGQSLFKDYFKHIKTHIRFALTLTYVHIWREFYSLTQGFVMYMESKVKKGCHIVANKSNLGSNLIYSENLLLRIYSEWVR